MKTYDCEQCGDEWIFDSELFEGKCPCVCPHCEMPITEMWRDVYKEEGLIATIRQTLKRWW